MFVLKFFEIGDCNRFSIRFIILYSLIQLTKQFLNLTGGDVDRTGQNVICSFEIDLEVVGELGWEIKS